MCMAQLGGPPRTTGWGQPPPIFGANAPGLHQIRDVAHGDALRRVTSLLIWRIL